MKHLILLLLFFSPFIINAQHDEANCDDLAIMFYGFLETDDGEEFVIEVSNQVYHDHLYYYPSFKILDEEGNVVAKDNTRYYGIGSGFQQHKLEVLADMSFPFEGTLELYAGKNHNCSFPISIPEADYITEDDLKNDGPIICTNLSENDIIIDLSDIHINANESDFHINITDENGDDVYDAKTDLEIISIPTAKIGGSGVYYINIWDGITEEMLPEEEIEVF